MNDMLITLATVAFFVWLVVFAAYAIYWEWKVRK